MANRQLVMLNCKTSHKTPLVLVKPEFTHVSITEVGLGDLVWLHLDGNLPTKVSIEMESGLTPFPHEYKATRFQLEKIAGPNSGPTTIEVLRGA